jgi:Ca-activated chloride channel family protein
MAATDVKPDRIKAARAIAVQFLRELPSAYPVALVAFANSASLLVPPTTDRGQVIAALPATALRKGATAIGDAINYSVAVVATAAGQLQPGSLYRPGAVLVISDGGQNAGGTTPAQAAVSAAVDYVPVDSIAVGTRRGTVAQTLNLSGVTATTTMPVPVEPSPLRTVSGETQGSFFGADAVARDPSLLAKVYENLRWHVTTRAGTRALSAVTTGIALLLIVAGGVCSGLWFGRIA